jgi:hypothetical protein
MAIKVSTIEKQIRENIDSVDLKEIMSYVLYILKIK